MHVTAFTNTFLIPNGSDKPTLQVVGPDETLVRKKRPHRCDELYPCGHCLKRNETCLRSRPQRVDTEAHTIDAIDPTLHLFPFQEDSECPVNLLHMELLHHFEKVTIPTLSFQEVWPSILQLAFRASKFSSANVFELVLLRSPYFALLVLGQDYRDTTLEHTRGWTAYGQGRSHISALSHACLQKLAQSTAYTDALTLSQEQHGYLVNAMLSLGAAHMSYLVPNNSRYRRAGCSLLGTALADFRQALSVPIDATNCDALLGTSILIQHLTWTDLSFLEDQGPTLEHPLDLSQDQLFLLSPGIRQIFHTVWPLFHTRQSVFTNVVGYKPYLGLEEMLMERGVDSHQFSRQLMDIYDDPEYHGGRNVRSLPSTPSSTGSLTELVHFDSPPGPTYDLGSIDSDDTVSLFDSLCGESLRGLSLVECFAARESQLPPEATQEEMSRAGYERLAARLSVVLSYLDLHKSPEGFFSIPEASGSLLSRYMFSFALLCFGPFLSMMLKGDSRALVLMFHLYQAARILLPADQHWWCHRRAVVLESMIGDELRFRGLEICTWRAGLAM
ncbi:hypothetical protein GQ53DRAFT_870058 [Thozetella sp. PMI_491]|nr:hypothetical protein GQ53DRAFT_870058 [Thozetella sp. PMI_491]